MMNFMNKIELKKHLPVDLLPKVTILLQDTGYVTISPIELNGDEWRRFNVKVKQMGGLWTFDYSRAHWSIPWAQ
jgi:hypothetical protein